MIIALFLTSSCGLLGGLSRPDRVVDPETAALVDSVVRSDPTVLTATLRDGQTVTIDEASATQLWGSGVGEGQLLLFGEVGGRTWYISSRIRETSPTPGCYSISADAAVDETKAVVFVFVEMRDVGVRIRKARGFMPPSAALTSTGQYKQGEVGHDYGSFCLNQQSLVFGMP